jgi:hypothetical protein
MNTRQGEPFWSFDNSVWDYLFPDDQPVAIRDAMAMHYANPDEIDTVDSTGMAKTIWYDFIDDDDRYYARHFVNRLSECWGTGPLDDYEDAMDDLIVESISRTLHWRAGVRF